jgi:hypothetical protein
MPRGSSSDAPFAYIVAIARRCAGLTLIAVVASGPIFR